MINPLVYKARKRANSQALIASCLAMGFGLFFLAAVLWTLVSRGLPSLNWSALTEMTPPPGQSGGLLNAIVGSLLINILATLIGAPIGILAGTYLSEYGRSTKLGSVLRFVNSLLLSTPSVVIGFFLYALVVAPMGHFSGLAGALALAVILIPIVTSNTENMLKLVPATLREASAALGAPRWQTTIRVSYQAAKTGLLTGLLLGVARISGESAPLLFTSLNNQFWNLNLTKATANLPVTIFQFAMSPYDDWQNLAWAGAFLITASVLVLNIFARLLVRKNKAT